MQLSKLITYSFAPNVGTGDRIFRVLSGLVLAILPWIGIISVVQPIAIAMTIFGFMWFMTGVLSRCGAYYMLGLSTKQANS